MPPPHDRLAVVHTGHRRRDGADDRHSNADCTVSGFKSHSTGWQGSIGESRSRQSRFSYFVVARRGKRGVFEHDQVMRSLPNPPHQREQHQGARYSQCARGTQKVRNFICKRCNDKTGEKWDSEIAAQLQPLCTMLNIVRERGDNQSLSVETISGRKLTLNPDGSLTIARRTLIDGPITARHT